MRSIQTIVVACHAHDHMITFILYFFLPRSLSYCGPSGDPTYQVMWCHSSWHDSNAITITNQKTSHHRHRHHDVIANSIPSASVIIVVQTTCITHHRCNTSTRTIVCLSVKAVHNKIIHKKSCCFIHWPTKLPVVCFFSSNDKDGTAIMAIFLWTTQATTTTSRSEAAKKRWIWSSR